MQNEISITEVLGNFIRNKFTGELQEETKNSKFYVEEVEFS